MGILRNQTLKEEDLAIVVVAGENISIRDSVYISPSDGMAYKTDADDVTKIGFVGFAAATVTTGNDLGIKNWGMVPGFSGLTVGAIYFVSGTAGAITTTKPTNYKIVGVAVSATVINITQELTKRVRTYTTAGADIGSSTTRFDITNPAGTTFRYTYDATGTDPNINSGTFPIGSAINFQAQNFNTANNGVFMVTGVGANYVEVTNASGVAENDKTIGTGYVRAAQVYTKTGGLVRLEAEVQGAGANAGGVNGGGAGGYAKKTYTGDELSALTALFPGSVGRASYFTNGVKANPGSGTGGGSATGGDVNIPGGTGETGISHSAPSTSSTYYHGGNGGDSVLGHGGPGTRNGGSPGSYGGGSAGSGYGAGGGAASAAGTGGVVILTEYY